MFDLQPSGEGRDAELSLNVVWRGRCAICLAPDNTEAGLTAAARDSQACFSQSTACTDRKELICKQINARSRGFKCTGTGRVMLQSGVQTTKRIS